MDRAPVGSATTPSLLPGSPQPTAPARAIVGQTTLNNPTLHMALRLRRNSDPLPGAPATPLSDRAVVGGHYTSTARRAAPFRNSLPFHRSGDFKCCEKLCANWNKGSLIGFLALSILSAIILFAAAPIGIAVILTATISASYIAIHQIIHQAKSSGV